MASSFMALLGMSIFSLVLLSLTIGMYTNYYEQMEPFAMLIFQQRRTKKCVYFMLKPAWQVAVGVQNVMKVSQAQCRLSATLGAWTLLMTYGFAVLFRMNVFINTVLLAAVAHLCQVALL